MNRNGLLGGLVGVSVLTLWLANGLIGAVHAAGVGPAARPTLAIPTFVVPVSEATGAIQLQAPGAPATAWTVVQWQDGFGAWHTVEGWRGGFDADGYKTWWFPAQHFGSGPFRWVVYTKRDGAVWGVSEPFRLPTVTGAVLGVAVFTNAP